MKKTFISIIVIVVVIAAVAMGIWLTKKPAPEQKVIKIGAILPLTGPASATGVWVKNGLEMALSSDSPKVKLLVEDSMNDPKTAVSAFNKLVEIHKVSAIITALSSVSLAILPLAEQRQIPLFITLTTYPDIASKSDWAFRLFVNNSEESKLLAEFAKERLSLQNVGVLYVADEGGRGTFENFVSNFRRIGGKVVFEEGYDLNTKDFRNILAKYHSVSHEGYIVIGYGNSLGILVKQIREVEPSVPILSTSQLGSGDAKTAAGTALIGAYYTAPKFNFSKEEDTVNFRNRYQQMYRERANFISAYAYDLGRFIAEVFKGAQHQEDGRMILQAAKQVKEFKGVTGEARIFANGEISTELVIVKALEGGGEDKEYETPK